MLVHEDRLFPADPATRAVARRLYERSATCRSSRRTATPIRAGSPRTSRFPTRRASSSCPTTTSSACSTARACGSRSSASRAATAARSSRSARRSGGCSPRTTTCSAARRRGSGSTMSSRRCSASRCGSRPTTADLYFDRSREALAPPEFRPRALFERFNIEVIATTESPLDELEHHRTIRDSGWKGRVVTAYRPDPVVDPEFEGFREQRRHASASSPARTPRPGRGYLAAHRKRRAFFKSFGATSTDHGHPTAPHRRPRRRPRRRRCSQRVAGGNASPEDAELFRAQMLTEMARDEPRGRAGDADPSGLVAQPQSRPVRGASAATRAPTSRRRPTMCAR